MPKWAKQVFKFLAPKLDAKIEQGKRDILEHLFGKSKRMKALLDYVHKPNELDRMVKKYEGEILKLKKDSHPPIFSMKDKKAIIEKQDNLEEHIQRLDKIAHPPFFSAEEKANMEDRIKQLEAIDYSFRLRNKDDE